MGPWSPRASMGKMMLDLTYVQASSDQNAEIFSTFFLY